MRIVIFGTGGVGGYFGGRLAQAGEEVTFIARGEHLEAMRRNGLTVESVQGDFIVQLVAATEDPASVGSADAIILATKAWQVPQAAEAIRPLLGPGTFVVPLQNGVDAPDQLAAALGRERVLGGLCRISAFIHAPGYIRHVGIQPYVAFGELDNRRSERVKALSTAFNKAQGLVVEVPQDIHVAMWEKFVFIAAVSGVGAVTRQPMGVYRSLEPTRAMLLSALEEVAAVGRARGVPLRPDLARSILTGVIDKTPHGTVASMQKDILEGRPSELEAQNGAVVRLGRDAGVETPVHSFLYASLLPQELQARGGSG